MENITSKKTIGMKPKMPYDDDASIASFRTFTTSGSNSRDNPKSRPIYVNPVLAEKEQKAVLLSKIAVITVLILAVIAMATFTYQTISNQEHEHFKSQFENYASEIIAVSRENVENSFKAIEGFSVTVSSYALDTNKTWPQVVVPHYHTRASRIMEQVGADNFAFMPVVYEEDRLAFEQNSRNMLIDIYQDAINFQKRNVSAMTYANMTPDYIFNFDNRTKIREDRPGPFPIFWQMHPFKESHPRFLIMFNLYDQNMVADAYFTMLETEATTISVVQEYHMGNRIECQILQPIFDTVDEGRNGRKIVGLLWIVVDWKNYFSNLLPDNADGVILVMKSSCGDISVTYEINGLDAVLVGKGDLHDTKYDDMEVFADFVTMNSDVQVPAGRCVPELSIHLYPSDVLKAAYSTNSAYFYTAGVVMIFLFTTLVFAFYDYSVRRRQRKVMDRVSRQDKIVSNLFPSAIKDRLYGDDYEESSNVGSDSESTNLLKSSPVADLFPNATLLFADIAGFTAWSSLREPPQVFTLLESIYVAFDGIAVSLGVFKIETVGDCYVAAAGLPEARKDHALVMAKFARECMHKMTEITHKLEVTLGPDTTDLEMRMGLNSGQVTGGVLRGERSRFQLFGDTVNTAARMESTSKRSSIQLSSTTASLLRQHGMSRIIRPRDETIPVKGKGEMQTYWLETKAESIKRQNKCAKSSLRNGEEMDSILESTEPHEDNEAPRDTIMSKKQRLVEWNVDVLKKLLQQIVASRDEKKSKNSKLHSLEAQIGTDTIVLEEFKEIITLPKPTLRDLAERMDPDLIELSPSVISQLRDYINEIAGLYRENSFHNFEHASHVTASVRKMLTRIVSFNNATDGENRSLANMDITDLVSHSYGITSDPLTQFSVVFSAIIHDADHCGVPNTQLVKEEASIASLYKEKSVAEQNSVDLAWGLLMRPQYSDLRKCIYSNEDELRRFRQLVVNTVMATDICDKELQALRKARWTKAFSEAQVDSNPEDDRNRKATIVIEHLIQASDVSHTMQHWHIYKQWNEKFFMECYGAYCAGRADTDPSVGWYKGEIGFFDFYVIPLAKKLENCGVFGVSSHEYLNYAEANRDEWAREGESIVKGYIEKYNLLYGGNV